MTMPSIVLGRLRLGRLRLVGLLHAHVIIGLSLLASIYAYIGGTSTVSYLFLVGACNAFCSSSIHPDHDQLAHLRLQGLPMEGASTAAIFLSCAN